MNIACIGGGPAGLYLGILVKRVAPEHDVVVYERNRADDTFGFGVVFSDATLGNLAAADPETHAQITAKFARWNDIAIQIAHDDRVVTLRSTGHGFCGLERKTLLHILQARAAALGVRVEYEHPVTLADVHADLVVGCDGVASAVRDARAAELRPEVDVRPNKFVWLGTTVPFDAFTFIFKDTPHGLFRVHAYRYAEGLSTFIVECRPDTWRAAGLAGADEDRTVQILEGIFARELGGHRLIKNRSIWRNFPTVRCGRWHAGNVVLLGDAVHTAHFSIGSGTKLAMEDAIALRDALLAHPRESPRDLAGALAAYEAKRRPEVEALQAAAQASLEWFEGTERYMHMPPVQLTYSLMTRSLRVSHVSVAKRDPELARGTARLLAVSAGVTSDPPPPPTELPVALGDRRARNRIAIASLPSAGTRTGDDALAGDEELVALGAAASAGAGLVVTPPIPLDAGTGTGARISTDEQAVAWARIVEFAHGKGARVVARIATAAAADGALEGAVQRAAYAGFDLVLLDPVLAGGAPVRAGELDEDPQAAERLPAMLAAARRTWRPGGPLAACVRDRPNARDVVTGIAAQLVRAGATLLWVSAPVRAAYDANARLAAAPLADQLRNELGVATAVVADPSTTLPDLDAAIAAGRADFVVVERIPAGTRAR